MITKKAKKKVAAKKGAKRKRTSEKNELNPEVVRKDISKLVEEHAGKMAQAVIGEGEKGQLATVKYLFEMAHIFPPSTDGGQSTKDEECLAKTLLDRLDLPDKPVVHDDDEDVVVIPAKTAEKLQVEAQVGPSEGSADEEDPVVG